MDLAHYQSPKLLGSSPPITNNRENLGQTSGEYPIHRKNLGWPAKGKIPDRLGFSRHMKSRLQFFIGEQLCSPLRLLTSSYHLNSEERE